MGTFFRNQRGSILLEAAVSMPILVAILLSMVEFGEAFVLKRRNAQVATTAADLVAQVSCVTTASLQDIGDIGGIILQPNSYTATIAGLRITSVIQNASDATVQWSYGWGALTAASDGATYTLPSGLLNTNQTIIVAQTSYTYTPTVGSYLTGGVTFSALAYNYPRMATAVTLNPSGGCTS